MFTTVPAIYSTVRYKKKCRNGCTNTLITQQQQVPVRHENLVKHNSTISFYHTIKTFQLFFMVLVPILHPIQVLLSPYYTAIKAPGTAQAKGTSWLWELGQPKQFTGLAGVWL
jgi:hypothetical protein